MDQRWEYFRTTIVSSRFEEEVVHYGSEGWELVSCPRVDHDPHLYLDYYLCIFKRPKGGA